MFKKKQEEVTERNEQVRYMTPDAKVYFEYEMSFGEKLVAFLLGFILGAVSGYVFYDILIISLIAGIGVGMVFIPLRKKQIINKQITTLKKQFKSMLESISTSIGAGHNVVDSFAEAYNDLKEQYSLEAYIVKELEIIIGGLHSNINIEDLLNDMADRSGIDDIRIFSDVFETCYRKGGNIKEVIASTYNIINDKMEIELEIQTMVASAKAELTMMCFMPIVFVFVLNSMGSNITGRGTMSGYIATTVALILFAVAYVIGQKLMTIKL